ncbi:D-alanyl-D-alanine carboxypeptidase family protein [Halalkalibacter akibai]|uniref:D-alanyl-D-alanine carboxypeptidase n=1 Tax=Halalkalibacter akibai (strain ATCC 43226 / DSM 21942 / CIP 109018 / JCM 9157 / 1139) TaxID=1236973 RepID=W4QUU1_HALA3|nr:D-alanyl-D-alanine carboxypeptidase family protein [Halalkalibacter akibai]GAE35856.1 D-alanyl-D-alanine carboxypeptidase [Halalkalibacter akibai JCM 9157]
MRRKFALICLAILLTLTSVPFNANAEQRNFSVSAQAAVLIEQESGRILYGKNENTPLRIASITKIMTAILAIESGKMDEMVKVTSRAEGTEGSSIYLRAGEKIKLEDLVYGLMLRSGNDSAVAIAEHVGGSLEGFVYLMNEKAKEIGMHNTMFQNPHGLDDHEDHYSTAYDMAILTQYAMQSEHYQTIASTKSHRVDGEQIRVWRNKNRLLTELYKYSTGGKTGYTKRAKRTLVSTAEKDGTNLIAVTLNAPSDWHDHMNLFNWAFDSYTVELLLEEGILSEVEDDFYKGKVYAPYSFEYPLTQAEQQALNKEITLYRPPSDQRMEEYIPPQPVGKVELKINNELIGQIPLLYEAPEVEEKKGFWAKVIDIFSFTIGVRSID